MHFHAHRFSISTALRLAPRLPKVLGDSILIEQILVNLLRNAFEAMGEARTLHGNVVVQTSHDDDRTVTVTVSDNGPGFGDIPLEQLFEPFYTTKELGMGLGLVISRSIAEVHSGRLSAERHPAGAAFHLTLVTEGTDDHA